MRSVANALSSLGGRRVLMVLGSLYVVLALGYPFLPVFTPVPVATDLLLIGLVGGPGLVLLLGAYRLPQTDIRPEFYATVATWCLAGIGVILAILGLIEAAAGLRDPVQNVLILTALAGVAGFAAGRYDARAKSRTRELELRNRELERTKAELEETITQLETANQRLEQFTYAASHDLQEPLRMVSSYLQLLETRYRRDLDDDAQEFIDFAVNGADRMRAMVESLLEYSRVSTRGEPLEPTDAGSVLESVLDDCRDQIDEADATVTSDELPTVNADRDQLSTVFENLLSNALTFSGAEPPQVHVSATRQDDEWRFAVSDDGVGIDPELQERIFTVFENFDADEEPPATSAGGVGLALCERIVERHGGDIWVESEPGEGSTFYFTMPTAEQTRENSLPQPQSSS